MTALDPRPLPATVPTAAPALSRTDLVGTLFGAAAFQTLHAGVDLGLFDLLHTRPGIDAEAVRTGLGLAERSGDVLLQAAASLRLVVVADGRYRNADLVEEMIGDTTFDIVRDLVAFEAKIVYPAQQDTVESLRTDSNVGLGRFPGAGDDLYRRIAGIPELEALFYRCMRSWSRLSNPVLLDRADLTGVRRVLDVGGGDGVNAIALAQKWPEVEFTVLDLPGAGRIAADRIAAAGLSDRISVADGDIFDAYPGGHDCVLFANQLVIWTPEENRRLLGLAHDALPDGGRVLVFNAMSDDTGDGPLYAALDNLYFLTLPTGGSRLYRWGQYEQWLREAGFSDVERLPGRTWTPHGVIGARRG